MFSSKIILDDVINILTLGLRLQSATPNFRCLLVRRTRMTSTGVNFINVLRTDFTLVGPESVKRYWRLNCIFCAFGIYECKSCTLNIDEINPRSLLDSGIDDVTRTLLDTSIPEVKLMRDSYDTFLTIPTRLRYNRHNSLDPSPKSVK